VDLNSALAAVEQINQRLLARRNSSGWWTGQLSTSALSTATAVMALLKACESDACNNSSDRAQRIAWTSLIRGGLKWLATHQNADGGWGDTVLSISNISTTMLVHASFHFAVQSNQWCAECESWSSVLSSSSQYIAEVGGVAAVIKRYGKDRTFSVPILTHCALAGIVDWKDVIPLPFELSCVPHRWYAAVRMPVVSYALPALIAIGQVIFKHQGHWNPVMRSIRNRAIAPSLRVLERIQPPNGGFLEATPLTSFVCMSLIGCGLIDQVVTQRCLRFIEDSVCDDGSWPIDTNLTTWVTTLSINALSAAVVKPDKGISATVGSSEPSVATDSPSLQAEAIGNWLLGQQYRVVHPYTHSAPGGWSWTDLPGGVPDADDTPGAMLALMNLRPEHIDLTVEETGSLQAAAVWLMGLQNRDGGWPTFCRGWGTLPFDRSSNDLTAHALRALHMWRHRVPRIADSLKRRAERATQNGLQFLRNSQRADGTWLPLWFGHQFNHDDENPLYGTSRVIRAFVDLDWWETAECRRAVQWMLDNQNDDGGWSARRGLISSVEETGVALDALAGIEGARNACNRAACWIAARVDAGTLEQPTPIGFYFARLWYYEALYPLIFAAAGMNRWAVRWGPK
jgi:squalene-hopene/tetraprenyl-beta-curcumene cyclase